MPPPLLCPSDKEISCMPGELQVGFRQQKHFQVKLNLMLAWVSPLTGVGQWCHCHHSPTLHVPRTWWRCGQVPTGRQPFHVLPSSKHHRQNATQPSALHEVQVCDGLSILRAWHCFPGSEPAGGLGKKEKPLLPGEHMCPRTLPGLSTALVHFMKEQGSRQAVLPTFGDLR